MAVSNMNFRPYFYKSSNSSNNNSNNNSNNSSYKSSNESSDNDAKNLSNSLYKSSYISQSTNDRRKKTTGSDNGSYDQDKTTSVNVKNYNIQSNSPQQRSTSKCRTSSIPISSQFSSLLVFLILILQIHLFQAQNANQRYKTAFACEGDKIEINCEANHLINVIRANFGRFSITICNKDYNVTLPTKCMAASAHRIIHKLCHDRQNCSVLASDSLFDINSCHGVPKYLEVMYNCINSNPLRNSKRPHIRIPFLNKTSSNIHSKNGPIVNKSNDVRTSSTDTAIYDSRSNQNYPTDNELNRKSIADLDNNKNPFLLGKRVPSSNLDTNNRIDNDQSSFNQINSQNSPNKLFEIKESSKSTLDNSRSNPVNLTNHCPSITKRGVTFDQTQAGKLVSVACPAGASNMVSWYCASGNEDAQRAMWYPKDKPDFSKCSSLWLNSMEERLKEKYPVISKLAQELASVTNIYQDTDSKIIDQNSFLGLETPKRLNSVLSNERQQTLYARDLYRISEITSILVNKLESFIEITTSDKTSQQFNNKQRTKQSSLIREILINLQDTISNILVEQNRESWLEQQPTERTLAISSLMSSLKKNALLFASVRPSVSSNFDRITRNLFIGIYVRQTPVNVQPLPLQLPTTAIKRSTVVRSETTDDLLTSEIGDEESDDKQASRCCSVLLSSEKIAEQSMQNQAKFIFIIYEQLSQLMPIEEMPSKKKRSINLFENSSYQTDKASDKTISVIASEIVSIFSQKESSIYSLPNTKTTTADHSDKFESYIELTFIHNKFGLQDNLTNFRCVQIQDSETIPFTINGNNNRVLSVEQAVANEQTIFNQFNQPVQISTTIDYRFLAQSSACRTSFTNLTHTTCRCINLGTFTVLADLGTNSDQVTNQLNIQNRIQLILKLNRICISSCGICTILLLITIVSFYFHKNNLKSTKTINHLLFLRNNQSSQLPGHLTKAVNYQNILLSNQAKINYMICLFFLECAMLISLGLSESAQNTQVFCRFASLAIHYFLLTVFAWLLFDCFISSYLLVFTETRQHQQSNLFYNQAQPLVVLNANGFTTTTTSSLDLQNSTRQYTLRTCKLLTYFIPLGIVVLSSWIDPSSYCSKSSITQQAQSKELYAICWHQMDNIYIMFFVVPLIALLLASIVFIVVALALRIRMNRLTNQQQSNKKFTFLTPTVGLDALQNQKPQQTKNNRSLFASNTQMNLFNVLITSCCWLFASFYLNNLLETFENFHFNNQLEQQSTYVEPLLASNLFIRTFTQLPDSNLALFAFLFAFFNILHCLVLLIKFAIRQGLIGHCCSPFCMQFTSICLSKSKDQSLNNLSQLYMPPNYYNATTDNQQHQLNQANSETLKFDQKHPKLNKFESDSLNSASTNQQQQPLIPAPQLMYQLNNNRQQFNQMNRDEIEDDDVYENDEQKHFSEQQSTSETMLASSDLQTSEQSDSEQFLLRNKNNHSFNDQYGKEREFPLKKNKIYGQKLIKATLSNQSNAQMENFYECIEDNGTGFYEPVEPMIYSAAYGENQQTERLYLNKYNRFMNSFNQQSQNISDADSEYENPIERMNKKSIRTNKLLRNYSSNDFSERDIQLDQPLLPEIIRDNTNNHQFSHGLSSSTNHRNFNKNKQFIVDSPTRFNSTNASFSSTIGRNVLFNSANGLRTNFNFRTNNGKQTKDMTSEQNLKQIQQQLKQFKLQLAMNNSSNQEEELKDHCSNTGQSVQQQNNYLSSNSSVSDNVNSSV